MRLATTLTIYAGGQGSGCNPKVGKCGRPSTGKGVPKLVGIKSRYTNAVKETLQAFPKKFISNLVIKMQSGMGGGGGSHLGGGKIILNAKDFSFDASTGGMTGRGVASDWYWKNNPNFFFGKKPDVVKDAGAFELSQVLSHEIGHAIQHDVIEPNEVLNKEFQKVFDSSGTKIHTPSTSAYENYFRDRTSDYEERGITAPQGRAGSSYRLRSERFAEAVRMKIADPQNYAKLPVKVKSFLDKVWKS